MLRTYFIGNLGQDPEVRFSAAGNEVVTLNVAVNSRRQVDGNWQERTDWFRVRTMGQRATYAKRFAKGERVFVAGGLEIGEWTDRQGGKRMSLDVWADELSNLSPRREGEAEPGRDEIDVDGATFQVEKEASAPPRR